MLVQRSGRKVGPIPDPRQKQGPGPKVNGSRFGALADDVIDGKEETTENLVRGRKVNDTERDTTDDRRAHQSTNVFSLRKAKHAARGGENPNVERINPDHPNLGQHSKQPNRPAPKDPLKPNPLSWASQPDKPTQGNGEVSSQEPFQTTQPLKSLPLPHTGTPPPSPPLSLILETERGASEGFVVHNRRPPDHTGNEGPPLVPHFPSQELSDFPILDSMECDRLLAMGAPLGDHGEFPKQ